MLPRKPGVSTRFFLALAVLLGSLVAVGTLGLHGLDVVHRANDQVFEDNFLTAQTTSGLSADLSRAQVLGLEILGAREPSEAERLRARLNQNLLPAVNADIARLLRLHAGDPASELAQLQRIPRAWGEFVGHADRGALAPGAGSPSSAERSEAAAALQRTLDPLIAFVNARQSIEVAAAATAHAGAESTYVDSRDWLIAATLIALVAAGVMVRAGRTLRRLVREQAREQRYGESASEYVDTLQATENEDEAQELLRRQIERTHPDARAAVLVRNNSADRLEPRTSLVELEVLREPLLDAVPRSCLAVRFARGHQEGGGEEPLSRCEICGALEGTSTCEPLLVGSEVIGSVLVNQPREPDSEARRRMRDTVAQAAPVLANLRNLAIAELRAATDPLTGLPNQRAVQDTLKRMVAQASRTITPLAAVLVDLDHFKKVNDLHGHDRGDEVLAAAGVAFRNVVRESDFVGRYGGEEFLLLLPSTDRGGALQVAEAAIRAIAAIRIPHIEQPITASAGVAVLPDDGGDAVTLFRAADRALYAAKNNGRNQVHTEAPMVSGRR